MRRDQMIVRFALLSAAYVAAVTLRADSAEPWVVENEDNDHYFYCGEKGATREALEAYADSLLEGGRVNRIFWCVNGQRPNYDSKVWEPIWAALGEESVQWGHGGKAWPVCAKALFDAGIDPYRVWIDRTRAKGASPWVSMRMNDNHDGWLPHAARVCRWYKDHPEFRTLPGYTGRRWEPYALDFAHPEVREHTFALFDEIVNRYDADGVEMDFMRASTYFRTDQGRAHAPVMTEFIRRCRTAAAKAGAKRGRDYAVAIRLPYTLERALSLGFDAVEIARQGLVDVIIVCNESQDRSDWNVPFDVWKAKIGAANPKVRLVAGTTAWMHRTPETLRGWTSEMRGKGAEDFYIFNLHWADEALRKAVRQGGI